MASKLNSLKHENEVLVDKIERCKNTLIMYQNANNLEVAQRHTE